MFRKAVIIATLLAFGKPLWMPTTVYGQFWPRETITDTFNRLERRRLREEKREQEKQQAYAEKAAWWQWHDGILQLRKGMTQADVQRILGRPERVNGRSDNIQWMWTGYQSTHIALLLVFGDDGRLYRWEDRPGGDIDEGTNSESWTRDR